MATHNIGNNTVVEEDGNGDTIIKNTVNGNEIQLDTIIELIGSDVSLEDDDKLFLGDGNDWSLRYNSPGTALVVRDEAAATDILTLNDNGSTVDFDREVAFNSGASLDDSDKLFFGDGDDWSLRHTGSEFVIRDETTATDIATFADGGSTVDVPELVADTLTATDGTLSNSPTEQNDLVIKSYVDSLSQGNDWQESVITEQNDPPASPADGDRYLVGETPTGAWSSNAQDVAEWDADNAEWVFSIPDEGTVLLVENPDGIYQRFNGTDWVVFGSAFDHGSLQGLTDDDHTQYILVDGSRAFGGDIDAGSNDLTNVSNADTDSVSNKDYNEAVNSIANATGTTDIDLSLANMHEVEADGDITFTFSNVTSSPEGNSMLIRIYDDDTTGPHTLTWPASVEWDGGNTRDTVESDGEIEIALRTYDGGTTWKASRSGRDFA